MEQILNAGSLSEDEPLRKYAAGFRLFCPVCKGELETIPAGIPPGNPVTGLKCPTTGQHFLVYAEDEYAMKTMRAHMKAIAARNK